MEHAATPPRAGRVGRRASLAVLALYAAIAFAYFGVPLLLGSGREYVGLPDDPQIPIWGFAWWLHAIEHFQNPFIERVLWAPSGVNIAWVNSLPALAVVFAPVTALIGPVATYNLVAILLPAVSAWSAFLLCRHVTRKLWPSVVGGYLFGFSSYVVGHMLGQPQLTAVFVIPLVALVVLRRLEGELDARGVVLRVAPLVAIEIYSSTELALTLTLVLAASLVLGFVLAPAMRRPIRSSLAPLAYAYAVAGLLGAPLLYYSLRYPRLAGFQPPARYTADLLNFVLPTSLEASGAGWAGRIAAHYPGNLSEQGAFVGLPLLLIVVLYARRGWRTSGGRFLLVALVLAAYLSLGPELIAYGHRVFPLPTPLGHERLTVPGAGSHLIPLVDNILPVRFALYASLAGAVLVALWMTATTHRVLRWLLPGLTVLLLVPSIGSSQFRTGFSVPELFTSSAYRRCLRPNEIVLPQPIGEGGHATLWQAMDAFRYRIAGGRLQTSPPSLFLHPPAIAQISVGYPPVASQTASLRAYIKAKAVSAAIVEENGLSTWGPALDRIAKPRDVGGVILYRFDGRSTAAC